MGDTAWIATTKSRIFRTPNKGGTWEVIETPVVRASPTEGIYSMAFYNAQIGIVMGGDYTQPGLNTANKAISNNGGNSWELIADGLEPGYKSCVQYVPNSGGKGLVAVGFTGVAYSSDGGVSWEELSEEPFYTLRFLNDSVAFAAGKNRIVKLSFK